MESLIRRILQGVAPRTAAALLSARSRAHSHRVLRGWGCGPLQESLIERFGTEVLGGPFKGLVLTPMTYAEQIGPFLLGVYESELDDAWATVRRGDYRQIVDVGAKFGFYAVGLARMYPKARVFAFDTDWWARKAVRQMAAANGTPNVEVKGFCTPRWLMENVREDAFILSDCEGFEDVLFNSEVIATLGSATLIIETHDCFVPGVLDRLRLAFKKTHVVRTAGPVSCRRSPGVDLGFLSDRERRLASEEVRPDQVWLLCLPKCGPNAGLAQM